MERACRKFSAALDPNLDASYSYWRVSQYTSFAG